ncbi:hypothetical protein SPFM7_00064 [Salmonella phage SPFM7]|nr:hypothetical protein SPFM7_00064 [Salmonella phage SPFM7]
MDLVACRYWYTLDNREDLAYKLAHELADTSQHSCLREPDIFNEVQRVVLLIHGTAVPGDVYKGVIKHLSERYSMVVEILIKIVLVSFHVAEMMDLQEYLKHVEINGNRGMIWGVAGSQLEVVAMLKVYSESSRLEPCRD